MICMYLYYQTKEVKADFDKQTKTLKQLEAKTIELENQIKVNQLKHQLLIYFYYDKFFKLAKKLFCVYLLIFICM